MAMNGGGHVEMEDLDDKSPDPLLQHTENKKDEDDCDGNNGTQNRMLYTINDVPPISTSIFLGLQHYLLAVGGIIGLPLILSPSLCMFETVEGLVGRASIINSLLFVSGICTFLQTTFGVRLPIMQGASYTFVTPALAILHLPENKCPTTSFLGNNGTILYNDTDGQMIDGTELWQRRMRLIQGAILVSSIVEVLIGLTGLIGVLMRFVNPVTIAVSIMLIGIDLVPVAHHKASSHWGISILTSAIIIICSQYISEVDVPFLAFTRQSSRGVRNRRFKVNKIKAFKLFPVMIAVVICWILSAILTSVGAYSDDRNNVQYWARTDARMSVLKHSKWFWIPYPFQWGFPRVVFAGVVGMLAAVIGGIIESIGDYYACAKIAEAPMPPPSAINRGIAMEGFGCVLNGLVGTSAATTSFSENCGAIGITRVGSRRVLQCAGVLMILLGTFGKFGGFLVMIPDPIIGGIFMVVFSMIVSVGVGNLQKVNLNNIRNVFIVGTALFLGLMVPQYLRQNPDAINTGSDDFNRILLVLLEIPMLVGAIVSIFFDATLRGREQTLDDYNLSAEKSNESAVCYDLPFNTNFKFSKYFPFLPQFDRTD